MSGVRIEVRVAATELELWREAALVAGVSVSELVRGGVNRSLASVEARWLVDGPEGESWREVFLNGLRRGLSVAAACREAGVSRALVYRERTRSGEFGVAWELALEEAEEMLADNLHGPPLLPRSLRSPSIRYGPGTQPECGGVRCRRARLQVRLTSRELEEWRAAAAAIGVSVSGLVRRLVRGAVVNPGGWERRTGSWRPAFIAALRQSGYVADACRIAGVSRTLAYRERGRSRAFAAAWEVAATNADERIEVLLWQRAMLGVPVAKRKVRRHSDGTQTTTVTEYRRYSTWALMELLRRRDPRYRS